MNFLKKHWLPIILSFVVGIICLAPHVYFRYELGHDYKGLYLMQTDNETEYLGRLKEIDEGHWKLGSIPLFEYKDKPPLLPPSFAEFILVGIHKITGISLVVLLIAEKAVLPVLLFLLIYFFTLYFFEEKNLVSRLFASASGVLVVLGYDILQLPKYILGTSSPYSLLLWTRPTNPITGAILLFALLILFFRILKGQKIEWYTIAGSALLFACAIASYYFSWSLALATAGLLGVYFLYTKRIRECVYLILITLGGIFLATPYLLLVHQASTLPDYMQAIRRMDAFYSHTPVMNTIVLGAAFLLCVYAIWKRKIETWYVMASALVLASVFTFNQQVITGFAVWPFHYVQYTKPVVYIILLVLFSKIVASRFPRKLRASMTIAILVCIGFAMYTQAGAYKVGYAYFAPRQQLMDVYSWFNKNAPKECVILSREGLKDDFVSRSIPDFTNCNVYTTNNDLFMIPFERIYFNYLVYLRINGISAKDIDAYTTEHRQNIIEYFYGTQTTHPIAKEYHELEAQENLPVKVAQDYKEFLKKDFSTELLKYKIDYVLSQGELDKATLASLHNPEVGTKIGEYVIYILSN